jgi:hypothetical protein
MKRLLLKGALLAGFILGLMLAVFLLPLPYNHDLSAILNKRDLLKDGKRDRIIFVGGSGLYSALDSALIQERLGRAVVNAGLYAGFGITPLLSEYRASLHAGDVVVIIPEYGMTFDSYNDEARKWLFAMDPTRNLVPIYGKAPERLKTFAVDFIGLVRSKFEALPHAFRSAAQTGRFRIFGSGGYVQYGKFFNEYGDSFRIFPAAASPETIRQRNENYFSVPAYRTQSFTALNDFCRDEAQQGVRTLFIFPAYPKEEYLRFRNGLRPYEQRLRSELACEIVGRPEDFLYPYLLFTDTIHHLGLEGKRKRTERIISLLEKLPSLARGRSKDHPQITQIDAD